MNLNVPGKPSPPNYVSPSSASPSASSQNIDNVSESPQSAPDGSKDIFNCQYCPKSFNRRENLSRHLKTHDSSKSHCCSKCGKGFTRSDLLKRHEAGHERWDREDAVGRPSAAVKRRKVAFRDPKIEDLTLPTPRWHPQMSGPSHSAYHPGQSIRDPIEHSTSGQSFQPNHPTSGYQNFQPDAQPQGSHTHSQETIFSNHQLANDGMSGLHLNPMDDMIPFDFSSFLLPTDVVPTGNEWFSYDFYSAMRETGHEWGNLGAEYEPNMSTPGQDYADLTDLTHDEPSGVQQPVPQQTPEQDQENKDHPGHQENVEEEEHEHISRVSSPPNEASEEDKWPFQWNPNSRQILKAHAIKMPDNHPLFTKHDPRFDITEATLVRLKSFLHPPSGREFHKSQKGTFVLPSLPIINVFISLFFEKFSPQMPVLHHATVNTNSDLPPPLLAAIIIIGAIHSHIKHTRRFGIVLLDIVRWHLRIALECDNSLMRDPHIIYAEALICHTGLWCGNKRAFELAEVVRGALITYIRRVRFGEQFIQKPSESQKKGSGNLQTEWKQWIAEESQRRLAWVIYSIDSQFPSILNLPPSISIGEVRNVGCPCDEEFWCATSARNWKNLLGPASVPPSRSFSAAVGPFLLVTSAPGMYASSHQVGRLPVLSLNPWSAFLVLVTITHQIFQFSQESTIAQTFDDDSDSHDAGGNYGPVEETIQVLRHLQSLRRDQLSDALASWSATYLHPSRPPTHPSSLHFHASSVVLHSLSTILLDVPLSDLQNAIGKDGTVGIATSMAALTSWARRAPDVAEQVALNAVKTIMFLAPATKGDREKQNKGGCKLIEGGEVRNIDTAQYGIITVFLCHVILWVFSSVSPEDKRQHLLDMILRDGIVGESWFLGVVKKGLGLEIVDRTVTEGREAPKVIFRSAAEMLTRLGTWGASLNLALLLHKRSEMQ